MKVAYLNSVVENCYQPQHISDDFTNEEQIKICKAEQFQEVFGTYMQNLQNHRESDSMRMSHCMNDFDQDVLRKLKCIKTFVKDT